MEQSTTESGQSHLSLFFNNENVLPLESFVLTVNNQPRVQVNFTLFAKKSNATLTLPTRSGKTISPEAELTIRILVMEPNNAKRMNSIFY